MTDINVMITDVKTGEELDKFSVHKGNSSTREILVDKVRDSVSIHSELLLDHYVHRPKEGHATTWEIVSPFVSRLEVPGGWIYQSPDKQWVFVPDPEYHAGEKSLLTTAIDNISMNLMK